MRTVKIGFAGCLSVIVWRRSLAGVECDLDGRRTLSKTNGRLWNILYSKKIRHRALFSAPFKATLSTIPLFGWALGAEAGVDGVFAPCGSFVDDLNALLS